MKTKLTGWFLAVILASGFCGQSSAGGLSDPKTEALYGGSINGIDAIATSATATRVYISTGSANTMFYGDIDHSGTTPTFGKFQVVPSLDSKAGYGSGVMQFAVDTASQQIFFIANNSIYSSPTAAGSVTSLGTGAAAITARDGWLFYVGPGDTLNFGMVSSSGIFTPDPASPLTVGATSEFFSRIIINPSNNFVYLFKYGTNPLIYKSSTPYNAFSGSTTFTKLSVDTLTSSGNTYNPFGIGPNGRIFAGASNGTKLVAYTDTDGDPWTVVNTGIVGTYGSNITASGTSDAYNVYMGSAVSTDKGNAGTWHSMPNGGTGETHPNDGATFADPNDASVICLVVDSGFGVSVNGGTDLQDWNDGISAVQINDFDMNSGKTIAWSASKSGVRQVVDYGLATEKWSSFFPNFDGSPYYSCAMDKSDATGMTAYAGNSRLYKTKDGGVIWERLFATEDHPDLFGFTARITSVVVSPSNSNIALLGVNQQDKGLKGAIYYTVDATSAKSTWTKLDTGSSNTRVQQLLYVDGAPAASIYVACEYDGGGADTSYGVKKITYDSVSNTFTYIDDMISASTSLAIKDFGANGLAFNTVGDVYACGADSMGRPVVYVSLVGTGTWNPMATTELPVSGTATAITIGKNAAGTDIPYIAVAETVYYFDNATSAWTLGYTYPNGTSINVLYWDDLLVGTGVGLFAQSLEGGGNNPSVTIGSPFTLTYSSEIDKKPTVYAKDSKGKKKSVKVKGKSSDYPSAVVSCEWTAKCPTGEYSLYIKGKTGGVPIDVTSPIGTATVMSPEVTAVKIIGGGTLDIPGSILEVTGNYFGSKPKVRIIYDCVVQDKTKTGVKSNCRIVKGNRPDDLAGTIQIFVPKFRTNPSNRILYINSRITDSEGYPLTLLNNSP